MQLRMPCVSHFFGIAILLWYRDHEPPHFHAEYGDFEAVFRIDTLEIIRGELPRRATALVLEWAALNRAALLADWALARAGQPVAPIPPLDP